MQTRVVAPADGIIVKRTATVGAVVQPGAEMFRLIRGGQLEWLAELPGHSLARVSAGGKAHVFAGDSTPIEATVRMVAPTLDAASRNGLVYVTLPPGAGLKAGTHARGEILLDSAQALAVPEASIFSRDGYSFVYVVGADEIARVTRIETGARQRGLVEVTAGLNAAARVVAAGAGFVKDGELVRVAPEPAKPVAEAAAAGTGDSAVTDPSSLRGRGPGDAALLDSRLRGKDAAQARPA
jgi:RND family efflux transporter MFP subunit